MRKIFAVISILILTSSCHKFDRRPVDAAFNGGVEEINSKVIFKLRSDRLVYHDKGVEKNAVMIKWCRAESKDCAEYFYSFHCDKSFRQGECNGVEKDLRNKWKSKIPTSQSLFPESYGSYMIRAGTYYVGSLSEVPNYHFLEVKNPFIGNEDKHDSLLEKRLQEMKPIAKDSIFSKAFFYPGAFLIEVVSGGGISDVGLVLLAAGGSLVVVGLSVNQILTGDFLYIGNFRSVDGWDKVNNKSKFISFKVGQGEEIYLGDIYVHLRARGGFWSSRRDGIIDVDTANNLKGFLKEFPDYKHKNIKVRLPELGSYIGEYGVGNF